MFDRMDLIWLALFLLIIFACISIDREPRYCLQAIPEPMQETPHKDTKSMQETSKPMQKWTGIASYYSEDGCVGCSPDLTMANGKRFDEDAMTLAFNRLPLGSFVDVCNTNTGLCSVSEVTDTGGFERLGRIADLSKGLKEAINCTDLCEVEITK